MNISSLRDLDILWNRFAINILSLTGQRSSDSFEKNNESIIGLTPTISSSGLRQPSSFRAFGRKSNSILFPKFIPIELGHPAENCPQIFSLPTTIRDPRPLSYKEIMFKCPVRDKIFVENEFPPKPKPRRGELEKRMANMYIIQQIEPAKFFPDFWVEIKCIFYFQHLS